MAGLGRKDFQAGAVLSAADVDGYLMDQSVMKFANTAAAGSAYGTAIAEGMNFYLSDTDEVVFHNGTTFTKQGSWDVAGKNKIINGGFDIWQRATSGTATNVSAYTADRFETGAGGTGVFGWSRQTFTPGQTDVPGSPVYYSQLNFTTSGSSDSMMRNRIEDVATFAGQTATWSFYAKVSSGTKTLTPRVVQNFGSGGSSSVVTSGSDVTLTTSWQRFVVTTAVPSISGKTIGTGSHLRLDLSYTTTGVLTYDFANWQLEAGSVATPFSRAGGTLQGELAACQRYFYKMTSAYPIGATAIRSVTLANPFITHPVEMRTTPTFTASGTNAVSVYAGTTYTSSALGTFGSTPRATILDVTSSGMTAGFAAVSNITVGQTIEWSAEL